MKRQSGFTLIELLLVLAIIGIISAIAIPALLGQRDKAKQKATEATAQAVVSEITGAAKLMNNASAARVITYISTSINNFRFPNCKNAYTNTSTALITTSSPTDGQVGVKATTAVDINGSSHNVINVYYKHKGVTAVTILASVPVE